MDKAKLGLLVAILGFTVYNTVLLSKDKESTTVIQTHPGVGATTTPPPGKVQLPNNNQPTSISTQEHKSLTSISFEEDVHEFGNVELVSSNKYSFQFKNTGTEPLIISNARGSCGCTVPKWPKDPIMPGAQGSIDVVFTPKQGQAGSHVEKTVTVTANTSPTNTVLRIRANVAAK